jgi:hypothetical protein
MATRIPVCEVLCVFLRAGFVVVRRIIIIVLRLQPAGEKKLVSVDISLSINSRRPHLPGKEGTTAINDLRKVL